MRVYEIMIEFSQQCMLNWLQERKKTLHDIPEKERVRITVGLINDHFDSIWENAQGRLQLESDIGLIEEIEKVINN